MATPDDQIDNICTKLNEAHVLWKYAEPSRRLDQLYKMRVYAAALAHLLEPPKVVSSHRASHNADDSRT